MKKEPGRAGKGLWWFGAIAAGIGALFVFACWPPAYGSLNVGRYYLLSTISQALAAVFALAFTITVVASQFAARYSLAAVGDAFGLSARIHAVLYIVAIVYPWFLLRQTEIDPLFDAPALALSIYCLAWLLHHFMSMKDAASPQRRLGLLAKNALRALAESASPEASVNEIEDVAYAAHWVRDYTTLAAAQSHLACILGHSVRSDDWRTKMRNRLGAWCNYVHDDLRAATIIAQALASEEAQAPVVGLTPKESKWFVDTQLELLGMLADPGVRPRAHSGLIIDIIPVYGSIARAALKRNGVEACMRAYQKMSEAADQWADRVQVVYPFACAREWLRLLRALVEAGDQKGLETLRAKLAQGLVQSCQRFFTTRFDRIDSERMGRAQRDIAEEVLKLDRATYDEIMSITERQRETYWPARDTHGTDTAAVS